MPALIRKELRELLWPAAIAAATFALVGLLGWEYSFPDALMIFWFVALPLAALLEGSHAVAKERTHRTLEWQSLWPVSRWQWWSAKLLLHLAVLAVGFTLVGLLAYVVGPWIPRPGEAWPPLAPIITAEAGATFLLFALSFLMSSLRKSTFEAFGLSLLAVLLLLAGWYVAVADVLPGAFGPRLGISLDNQRPWAIVATGLSLGLSCLLAAAWATFSTPVLAFGRRSLRGSLTALALCIAAVPCLILGGLYLAPAEKPDFGEFFPLLSPDGRLVSFLDDAGPYAAKTAPRLWVMNADGTGLRCLARGPVRDACVLPGDKQVVFKWGSGDHYDHPYHLLPVKGDSFWYLLDLASGRLQQLPLTDRSFGLLSPKGTYLVVGAQVVALADPTHVSLLPQSITTPGMSHLWEWAEDESAVFLVRQGPPSSMMPGMPNDVALDRVAIPSGKMTRDFYHAPPGATIETPMGQSRWVVLLRQNKPGCTLVALDGSASIPVPDASPSPRSISPDGRYAWLANRSSISVVDLTQRKVVRRLNGLSAEENWNFSPDSRWLWFTARAGRHGPDKTYVASADGSVPPRAIRPVRKGATFAWPIGWTAADQFLCTEAGRSVFTLSLDGRETTLLTATGPRREKPDEGLGQ